MKKVKTPFDYMSSSPDRYALLKAYARENRQKMTLAETILWNDLRALPKTFKFRRQHIIGDFIVDFVCLDLHLVIEVDGDYHQKLQQTHDDILRTECLNRLGFNVIRFTNEQVIENLQEVIREINNILYNE